MAEREEKSYTELWKARFELGEVEPLDSAFSNEEYLRILNQRIMELEATVSSIQNVQICLICVTVISIIIGVVVLSAWF